jgi:hypothetical protein
VQILDPSNHERHTVYRTRNGNECVSVGSPAPTWQTIERFIAGVPD